MQTSVQMNYERNADPIETSMDSDPQLMLNESSLQEEDRLSALDHDDTLVIALEETEEMETPATKDMETPATKDMETPATKDMETPATKDMETPATKDMETPATKEAAPTVESTPVGNSSQPNSNSQCDGTPPGNDLNVKNVQPKPKKDKPLRDGRKYVPSKKSMTDPLKIDMSKHLATPLSSSQISLQCIECHIIFSDHKSKERHLKASHPAEYEQCILRNALFACYVCDRHFTNSSELMVHQKTHIEKKPFKCPICSVTFSKLSELSNHKKIHFGQHGYTCTECGKPCKTLTLLKYHCRTHTGERPYICKECGKRFTMPKALQKHMDSHLPEGEQPKKDDAPSIVYACSLCKATFKSTKTRHYHMKKKHNISKAALTKTGVQLVRQCTPIITPISISQPSLLQVGPNGPLQKVDANIDTEQLRKLIESLGNVQKVNQVVILGQVPPDAPPLEVQQFAQPGTLTMDPSQVDFMMGLNQRTIDDPMEQTIILEPITPDGQLLNPPFSVLASNMADNPVAEVIFQQPIETSMDHQQHTDEMVCPNNVLAQNLQPNLNQTIVLELTPALTPTAELEQSENVLQAEIPPSTSTQNIEPNNALEMPLVSSISEQETSMSVQSLLSTVELEMLPLQTDQQMVPVCTFSPQETLTQDEHDSLTPTNCIVQNVGEKADTTEEQSKEVTAEQVTTQPDPIIVTMATEKNLERKTEGKTVNTPVKEDKVEPISDLPINVMSAQELVKVRKRKPPKAFFFQGNMQEFVSSIYDEFPTQATKRKKTKKSHLVVKFGPPSKGKQSKKANKTSKQPTKDDLKDTPPENKTQAPPKNKIQTPPKNKIQTPPKNKIQKRGKKEKKAVNSDSTAEIEVPASSEENNVTPKQKNTSKNNKKKQNVATKNNEKHIAVASPVFKKKQKKIIQSKSVKEKTETNKQKAADKAKEKSSPQSKAESTSHVIQDSLLLLKGHKQPQIKVHKLDPLQASGKTQDVLLSKAQTSPKDKDSPTSSETSPANKKKGGRSKKVLSLLSSLISKKQEEATPPKPTRKRKASSKVETEGIITSKKSIECKECGQRFSDVSLLQNHKATVHIIESPGITFTNGNLFEGVTRIDLYQLPKRDGKGAGLSTGWDTEPEMTELERERCVSFPALNTSPSLPVPPCDIYCPYEDDTSGKDGDKSGLNSSLKEVFQPSPRLKDANQHKSCTDMEVQATTDEDIKEDLVLEVDLVTVGEQSEKDDSSLSQDENVQNKDTEQASAEREGPADKQTDPTLHTVSCSTHHYEIKEEEEETVIERKKQGQKGVTSIEREAEKGEVSVEQQAKQDDCEILYEKPAADSDSDNCQDESQHVQIITKASPQKDVAPAFVPSLIGDEEVRDEREPASSRNGTQANEERQDGGDWERDQSPGIILEKVISTSLHSADKGTNQIQFLENENYEIKMEDRTTDSTQGVAIASAQPQNRDIRAVFVKEESRQTPQCDGQIQWSIEQNSSSSSPSMEATDSGITQNCTSSQCHFYSVKEEEREVLVGPAESSSRLASSEVCGANHQAELTATTSGIVFAAQEVLSEPGLDNPSDGQGAESESETTPNLRDFLLQSSDEEDGSSEWVDSHVDPEAEIMAHLYKKLHDSPNQSDTGSSASSATAHERGRKGAVKNPLIYFSKFFNWDTWKEISLCTNKLANMSSPVTAKEVAQFVGIHIAMGSLKYPSPRLYWEDLTKVPLVADAMPLSRFLELSRLLKLAYPQDNQQHSSSSRDDNINLSNIPSNEHCNNFQHHKTFNADPLWKIQPVLKHFVRGCRSLKRQGDYGIDQYPLPLTGKTNNNKHSLHCTTLVNFGGMVLDVDLKLDLSDKEHVAEKLAPKESMVFLCKQELSTPAMLDHLLAAGIHGAGQVGGAKGQIGDEFVSSDGKLMLRRSNCGFILSTTGNTQRNSATLTDNFEKAQISTLFNKNLQSLYSIPPSAFSPNRWPQTVLWFLTDLALINSWLLYRRDAENVATPLTLLVFRLEVSKALILTSSLDAQDSFSNPTENAHTPGDTPNPSLLHENPLPDAITRYDGLGHWPEQLAEGEGGRCRFGDCQRTSRVLCLKCCVFLCISRNHNCFMNFHNQERQEK